jgi:hypothetical protein
VNAGIDERPGLIWWSLTEGTRLVGSLRHALLPQPRAPPSTRTRTFKNASIFGAKSHAKKSVQSIDTNLSSYDRTDPFFAFNTLLKLLGSLPSRIGGCQFKFSTEEYKLSLHLLTIIEPFVGLAPSHRTIIRQPTVLRAQKRQSLDISYNTDDV